MKSSLPPPLTTRNFWLQGALWLGNYHQCKQRQTFPHREVIKHVGSLMHGGKLTHGTDKWLSNSCALDLSREEAGNRSPDQHMTITELENSMFFSVEFCRNQCCQPHKDTAFTCPAHPAFSFSCKFSSASRAFSLCTSCSWISCPEKARITPRPSV